VTWEEMLWQVENGVRERCGLGLKMGLGKGCCPGKRYDK
jgi:hypothetical protein